MSRLLCLFSPRLKTCGSDIISPVHCGNYIYDGLCFFFSRWWKDTWTKIEAQQRRWPPCGWQGSNTVLKTLITFSSDVFFFILGFSVDPQQTGVIAESWDDTLEMRQNTSHLEPVPLTVKRLNYKWNNHFHQCSLSMIAVSRVSELCRNEGKFVHDQFAPLFQVQSQTAALWREL